MPILDLSCNTNSPFIGQNQRIALMSYLLFPEINDEKKRKAYIAASMTPHIEEANNLATLALNPFITTDKEFSKHTSFPKHMFQGLYLKDKKNLIVASKKLTQELNEDFLHAGGNIINEKSKSSERYQNQFDNDFSKWIYLGVIVRILYLANYHKVEFLRSVSLNQLFQRDDLNHIYKSCGSNDGYETLWRRGKAVAHLYAAYSHFAIRKLSFNENGCLKNISPNRQQAAQLFMNEPILFLSLAKVYQTFLLNHTPSNRTSVLINEDEAFLIPTSVNIRDFKDIECEI